MTRDLPNPTAVYVRPNARYGFKGGYQPAWDYETHVHRLVEEACGLTKWAATQRARERLYGAAGAKP